MMAMILQWELDLDYDIGETALSTILPIMVTYFKFLNSNPGLGRKVCRFREDCIGGLGCRVVQGLIQGLACAHVGMRISTVKER